MARFNPKEYDNGSSKGPKLKMPGAGDEVILTCMRDGTQFRKSKAGNELLEIKLEVEEGFEGSGYWIFWSIPLDSEWTSSFAGQIMDAMGIDVSKPRELTPRLFYGKRCKAVIKHETYGGKTRAKINYFVEMSDEERDEPSRLKPRLSKGSQTVRGGGSGTSLPPADEEIPF